MKIKIGNQTFEITKEQLEKGEDVTIDGDFVVRTHEQESAFLNNIKSETSKAAIEIEVKNIRNELGLEFQGKTVKNLVEAITAKNKEEFSKEPTEQLSKALKDVDTLKETVKSLQEDKTKVETDFNSYRNGLKLESELKKHLPKNLLIPEDDALLILKSKLNPVIEGDKVVFKKGDEILKDKTTLDPLPSEKVMADFFAENKHYLKAIEGGKGGTDEPGGSTASSREQWMKKYEAAGGDMSQMAINAAMTAAIQSKELVI